MNKTYILAGLILIISNMFACLDKFRAENPSVSITTNSKPKSIERQIFIKYCLKQNKCNFKDTKDNDYVSEETIKSLTGLSENKSYIEIDLTIFSSIKNYRNIKITKKTKYREFVDSINLFNKKSLIEKSLFKAFHANPIKLFLEEHAPEIIVSSAITASLSLFAFKYLKKFYKPRPKLMPRPAPAHINDPNAPQDGLTENDCFCGERLSVQQTCKCSNGHEFHLECMKTWLEGKRYNKTCPTCRVEFNLPGEQNRYQAPPFPDTHHYDFWWQSRA